MNRPSRPDSDLATASISDMALLGIGCGFWICVLKDTPQLLKCVAELGAGQGSGKREVADSHVLLGVTHVDVSWK